MNKPSPQDTDYRLFSDGRFVIDQYNAKRPFSNFLPGIAGLYGTPMWVFYVNRGQGIASFGTRNKDNAILEFFPANKAYQNTPNLGFRTFLKFKRASGDPVFYEPFREALKHAPAQSLTISSHEFSIRESNPTLGFEMEVRYFTVPGEPIAALVREISIKNISNHPLEFEALDGLSQINPYGMNEFFVKNMSRTIEAWMVVENHEKKAPFFRLRVDATDRPEVVSIEEGNFFFSYSEGALLDTLVDPGKVFGSMLDFSLPKEFLKQTPFRTPKDQILENKTPCAFSLFHGRLAPGKSKKVISVFGQAANTDLLNHYILKVKKRGYFESKADENRRLIESIKAPIFSITSSAAYDLYCGQTYLDNLMRGGVPICVGDGKKDLVLHVYSRKHGDLERDYNRFLVEPTYFAQGDGNYRDVNQNRRSDVWFEPRVRDMNIRTFLNFIQLDGFNPLIIKGTQLSLKRSPESKSVLRKCFSGKNLQIVENFLSSAFSLGDFYRFLEDKKLINRPRFESLLKDLVPFLLREEKAEHGEGFWVDHWTYNLDLIESYLAVYPEDAANLLLNKKEFTFHDSDHAVQPRHEKYFIKNGKLLRQYQSAIKDKEKAALIASRTSHPHTVRAHQGRGDIYRTTLFVKLVCLFANKLASLDAEGAGIEMEADKPSWYDALNGLPGLLGSSLCETFELKRLVVFMIVLFEDLNIDLNSSLELPEELHEFVTRLSKLLEKHPMDNTSVKNYSFWDAATKAKEDFRAKTRLGLSGKEKKMIFDDLRLFLERSREKIDAGIEKSFDKETGLFPTYFENEAVSFKTNPKDKSKGWPVRFKQTALPYFLEGLVHAIKVEKDPERRRRILRAVRLSKLYDSKLGMYKVNASLENSSLEIGRARIFKPGWLENESIWLHMEYKFILEILKSGMAEEFFADFKKALVPFQPAARYGRSTLENSSFIVSSEFSDPSLHGGGFVARLSGSTAEFLSMWVLMNAGKKPFLVGRDRKISLRFQPTLPAWLFVKEDTTRTYFDKSGEEVKVKIPKDSLAFMFLGKTLVVYHNPKTRDTFGKLRVSVRRITLKDSRGNTTEIKGDTIYSPHADRIRDGYIPRIDIELG